ncbi:MAG: tRNA-dihydrouridine synthase, partial [Campylobacterales bacterium]|nr:tRNA-dihydrouridine synthase [Campylobacterales bacterium]
RTIKMLEKSENEDPYFVQLAGNDPEILKRAVEKLNEIDGIDGIDLNCGCPAPKIYNHGSGSNLLGDLSRLQELLKTIKKYSDKTYTTAKVRIGVNEKIPLDIAKAINDCGIDFVAVHGRTKSGAYKAPVDYDAIAAIKEIMDIPVIANGDITSLEKANKVLAYTKADGIMIGRGAMGKPWIFHQVKNNNDTISDLLKKDIIIEHFEKMVQHYGEYGTVMFRKHLHTYSKGIDGAHHFREQINQIKDPKEMLELIQNFF